jgi:Domain of unknown function (DUF4384)
MTRRATSARVDRLALALPIAAALVVPAWADDARTSAGDNSRSVRIIAEPTPAPADAAKPAPALTEPTPALPPPSHAPSNATPAAQSAPSGDVAALSPPPSSRRNPLTAAELDALSKSVKLANPADLAVEITPGPEIAPGAKVSFRITTKKPGYLILVDVDPSGKLEQIYPNPMSLTANPNRESVNLIRPGTPLQLPSAADGKSRFEFIASPPFGTAMVVALLSDRPVQMIDLPDVPAGLLGSTAGAELLSKVATELRIPDPKRGGAFLEPRWSFDAKFYAIK